MNIRRLALIVALSVAGWLLWRWQRRQAELPVLEPPLPTNRFADDLSIRRVGEHHTPDRRSDQPLRMREVTPSRRNTPLPMREVVPTEPTVPLPEVAPGKQTESVLADGSPSVATLSFATPDTSADLTDAPPAPPQDETIFAEPIASEMSDTPTADEPPPTPGLLNLNAATLDELIALPGIGSALAKRIIAYRDAHGPFASVGDLIAVQGIGPTNIHDFDYLLTVDPPTPI